MNKMTSITYSLASLGTFSDLPKGILMDLAEALRLLQEAEAAGFITEDGQIRKVVRRIDVGRSPSDCVDRICDVLEPQQVVYVCDADKAKEKA